MKNQEWEFALCALGCVIVCVPYSTRTQFCVHAPVKLECLLRFQRSTSRKKKHMECKRSSLGTRAAPLASSLLPTPSPRRPPTNPSRPTPGGEGAGNQLPHLGRHGRALLLGLQDQHKLLRGARKTQPGLVRRAESYTGVTKISQRCAVQENKYVSWFFSSLT